MTDATAPTLRPLGVGDIVDRTIGIYRSSPGLFLVLAALPYVILAIVSLGLNLAFVRTSPFTTVPTNVFDPGDPTSFTSFTPDQLSGLVTYGVVIGFVSLLVLSVQAAAIVDAMSKRYLGRPTTLGDSLRAGLGASGRLILASVVAFVSFIGLVIVGSIAVGLVAALTRNPIPVIIGVVGLFVFIVYAIASWMPLPAVVTLEGRGPVAGLRRAWQLAGGARWRILGLLVLMTILQVILGILFAFVFLGTVVTDGAVKTVLQEVANLAVNALWAPIQWGVFTLLYYDLRVRKEAFDLQLAAEAMPRAT
ncbi:MAG: hypothetical protein QOH08_579 [Chloroflexota bacterium]|nr:hypothetical protein [Chloroflexota bacterium]